MYDKINNRKRLKEQMSNEYHLIEIIIVTAMSGIGWLFKTIFAQNKALFDSFMETQKGFLKNQKDTEIAILKVNDTLQDLKQSLEDNNDCQKNILSVQKDLLDFFKIKNKVEPQRIVLSPRQRISKRHQNTVSKKSESSNSGDEESLQYAK